MSESETMRLRKTATTTAVAGEPVKPKAKSPALKRAEFAKGTYLKLAFFSILMFTLPIGSFFYTQKYIFGGNSTYSAIVAAVAANIVLIAYIFVAFLEGEEDGAVAKKSS
ncbi:vacuolar ATPase assembly integral membrane protein vma21 [Dinochytrium kinnereticum]|nr:vacuolar ATPase assembly integral membrane protein vma21 [Dinochytrium kinnereticum]